MEKDLAKTFAARITQASKTELVVIMYEVLLTDITAAREYFRKGDDEKALYDIKHGQKFLNELMGSLDFQYEISLNLMSLYIFVNKLLTDAYYGKDVKALDDAEEVLRTLMDGFSKIAPQDKSGPVMANTGQIYAGLTYGRGTLNETYVDPNQANRGFMA
ncbi:flagellar protein FliS [Anaerocolumna jejuensis DSM 15929]|jgi:flagellar protein FliS|uniref:Flagellar protein FliS n=1 Tax=Anaerocolumna jejuensis DSM 15929 TaxID=1121322 RepID=A0A1M6XTP5_9FIRM|nr:flagellar protein FliS [Anaerocolumna jejuensis]SHL09296.1 flagellar protein FliS [Anaerocolumna jejuensis DSM 15929]